jgi:hypothetical protein
VAEVEMPDRQIGRLRRRGVQLLGAALIVDVVAMLAVIFGLGPMGTCEAELNNGTIS